MVKILLTVIAIVGLLTLLAVIVSIILFPVYYNSTPNVGTLAVFALAGVLAVLGGFNSAFELFTKVLSRRIQQISQQLELDRKLFTKIQEILPSDGSIEFVRNHDFGGSFEFGEDRDLHDFLEHCNRPEFEFFDPEIEELRKGLENIIREFTSRLGHEVFPINGIPERVRIPRDPTQDLGFMAELRYFSETNRVSLEDLVKEQREHLREVRIELNELANKVVSTYDKFVRTGRRKLGV